MKKYVPKKITEAEIQEIRISAELALFRSQITCCPELKFHCKRVFGLLKDVDKESFSAQSAADELYLLVVRMNFPETAKWLGPDFAKADIPKKALLRKDHAFFAKLSKALKSQGTSQPPPTELFLLLNWARGSFTFTVKDSFPPLVLFTVRDLARLMQIVFEKPYLTESSIEATIGRKHKLKTIKHCKVTSTQADRWIQQFKAYKANHSQPIKNKLDIWDMFLKKQQIINLVCKKLGVSPAEAKEFTEDYLKNEKAFSRQFGGNHSDKGNKPHRRNV